MKRLLISWIGQHDLNAKDSGQLGPVLAAIEDAKDKNSPYDEIYLLCNYPGKMGQEYLQWVFPSLGKNTQIDVIHIPLSSPTAYEEIYTNVLQFLDKLYTKQPEAQKFVHLSPGTPAMTAIWILLTKTKFPAVYVESWLDKKTARQYVKQVQLPFFIKSDFLRSAADASDIRLQSSSLSDNFSHIACTSSLMGELTKKSIRIASRNVPALILSETGTGKEIFAKLMHEHSTHAQGAFIPVNCGALPAELAESLLFGHVKGAFTGAASNHIGFFKAANKGTLFLDEIGELSPTLQTKLLRVLQEKEFTPVGANKPIKSDFRLICATHRDLLEMVEGGSFREDLFYRIAIGILKIPALRDRGTDITTLALKLMLEINEELADQPTYQAKSLSDCALLWISREIWPGNVRELRATILRAAAWSDKKQLNVEDLTGSIIKRNKDSTTDLPSFLRDGIDIQKAISKVANHYITLALERTHNNKAAAAQLLKLGSPQVLTNWINKHCSKLE